MVSTVHFVPIEDGERIESIARKAKALFDLAGFDTMIKPNHTVMIKLHFGEEGNIGHINPRVVAGLVTRIRQLGAKPFLSDTQTLYVGRRSNAIDHLVLAHEHGFTLDRVGAPVIMADGLLGENQVDVEINARHYKKVKIAIEAKTARVIIALTHITGHPGAGLAGSIKNIGMGLASRGGKLSQHSAVVPQISTEKCVACGTCTEWCPTGAISIPDNTAVIDEGMCIGCGECLSVCPESAIGFTWSESAANMQEKMAEHTLGVYKVRRRMVVCMNFLVHITKNCDCGARKADPPDIPNIGIVASNDPVAADQATIDLINERNRRDIIKEWYPNIDYAVQLRHGEEIGLGSTQYRLVEVQ